MPQVQSGTAYVDQALTDVSIRYSNPTFIAEQVFPILPVPKETGLVFKFDKENLRAPQTSLRGDYARSERVDYGLTTVPYGPLLEHSMEVPISQRLLDMYQAPLQPEINATETATEKILIEKELGLANYLGTAGNFAAAQKVTLSGTAQWSDYTNSKPFTDIQVGVSAVLVNSTKKPNTVVLGRQVYDQLVNHPNVTDRLKYTARATNEEITNAIADLFGVQNVLIGEAVYNSAVEGAADSLGYIWGKNAYLLYVTPSPAVESVSAGYHLTLADKKFVDKWYEQAIKTEFVRANDFYTRFVMAAECIYCIYNAVA
jgi:hypothetical protein